MGVLWGEIGEGVVWYWPLTNSFFLFGVFMSVPVLVKIDQEMRPCECSQTDRQTDRQTQTDFIVCPMLYAIATTMGQIITISHSPQFFWLAMLLLITVTNIWNASHSHETLYNIIAIMWHFAGKQILVECTLCGILWCRREAAVEGSACTRAH